MKKSNKRLYMFVVCTTIRPHLSLPRCYCPILSGAAKKPYYGSLRDDSGFNISEKNPYFSEYSSLFWIWKNAALIQNQDYIGMCHYRRYFKKNLLSLHFLNEKQACHILSKHDVIVAKKKKMRVDSRKHLIETTGVQNESLFEKTILNLYPSLSAPIESVLSSNLVYPANLQVWSKKRFCDYMSFYFSVIESMESFIDYSSLPEGCTRVYGYFGEILLNIFILANKISAKELPIFTFRSFKRLFAKILPKRLSKKVFAKNLYSNGADSRKY